MLTQIVEGIAGICIGHGTNVHIFYRTWEIGFLSWSKDKR
jgi:hypothetical protein